MAESASAFSLLTLFGFGPEGWGAILLGGAATTVLLSVGGFALSMVIGALGAWAKISGTTAIRVLADGYTTVFRGIPELLVIYVFYFGGSAVVTKVGAMMGSTGFIGLPGFLAGLLAIGVASGAQQTEVMRGAFHAVARGELEAALACGMSRWLRFRRIVAPLVLRHALPGMGNVWQVTLKGSALVSITGAADLLRQAQVGTSATGLPFSFYGAAALLYLVISAFSGWALGWAEGHFSRGVRAS